MFSIALASECKYIISKSTLIVKAAQTIHHQLDYMLILVEGTTPLNLLAG